MLMALSLDQNLINYITYMDLDLSGKVVFITGSSRGIGLSIAEYFHSLGSQIVLNSRSHNDLKLISNNLPGSFIVAGDLSKPDQAQNAISQIIDAFGRLDVLVCNIGNGSSVPPGEECFDEWQRVFNINFWSTTNVVEAAKKSLYTTKGKIICISSICGVEVIPNAPVTYSVAKAALNAYVRGMARPLGKHGVTINAVAPGNILF